MRYLRIVWRLFVFVFYTLYIVLLTWARRKTLGVGQDDALRIRRRWANHLLHWVGVRVTTSGAPPDFPCIIVGNHRSYLDPIILMRDVSAVPVSKAEVRNWPLIGKGAQQAGILFLQRGQAGSHAATLRAIAQTVQQGLPVILYPEGDTSDLPHTLPFKKGAFQIAAKLRLPIVPAAIEFPDLPDCWIDQRSFMAHAVERFQKKHMRVQVYYGPPFESDDAEILVTQAKQWIDNVLAQARRHNTHI